MLSDSSTFLKRVFSRGLPNHRLRFECQHNYHLFNGLIDIIDDNITESTARVQSGSVQVD